MSWDEVAAMVSQTQAIWKAAARSGKSCLTRADFLAGVINDGQLPSSSSLITLDEFNAHKQLNARLINDVGNTVEIGLINFMGEEFGNLTVNAGVTALLPTNTSRILYQFTDNTRGGQFVSGGITPTEPSVTYRLSEYAYATGGGGGTTGGTTDI